MLNFVEYLIQSKLSGSLKIKLALHFITQKKYY